MVPPLRDRRTVPVREPRADSERLVAVALLVLLVASALAGAAQAPAFPATVGSGSTPDVASNRSPASHGGSATGSATIAPLNATVAQYPGIAAVGGGPNQIWTNVSGGLPPYQVSYQAPSECAASGSYLNCQPLTPGWAHVAVTVSDALGEWNNSSVAFYVAPSGSVSGSVSVGGPAQAIPSGFWGANLNFFRPPGYANSSLASYVNATPIRFLRFPLSGTWVVGQRTTNWSAIGQFCAWINCRSLMTIGGPGYNASAVRAAVVALVDQLGVSPTEYVYGNEPNLWNWSGATPGPLAYAEEVQNFTQVVRSVVPGAPVLAAEISGRPGVGDAYISEVVHLNGANLSGIGIQVYPQASAAPSLYEFMQAVHSDVSVAADVSYVRGEIAAACPSCQLPIYLDEFNGGTAPPYAPFRGGEPDAPFFAASIVQALDGGVARFLPWTLASVDEYKCDYGIVVLGGGCFSGELTPTYYLYADLLNEFGSGQLVNVTVTGDSSVSALAADSQGTLRLLLINTNVTVAAHLALGGAIPAGRCLATSLIDPAHPGPALAGDLQGPNGTASPTVTVDLAPLAVELLVVPSTAPSACPIPPPTPSPSLASWPILAAGALAGGGVAVWSGLGFPGTRYPRRAPRRRA